MIFSKGRSFLPFFKEGDSMIFTVEGDVWKLQFVNPKSEQLRRSDGSRTLGVTDDNLRTVFISDNLSEDMIDKVLCHELVHVFSFANDLIIPIETEEIIANFMSQYGRSIIYLADTLLKDVLERVA